jgi:hypothetical protein
MAERAGPPPPPPRTPQSRATAEVRRRIAAGFYDRPEVARETAARMLQRGPLTSEN